MLAPGPYCPERRVRWDPAPSAGVQLSTVRGCRASDSRSVARVLWTRCSLCPSEPLPSPVTPEGRSSAPCTVCRAPLCLSHSRTCCAVSPCPRPMQIQSLFSKPGLLGRHQSLPEGRPHRRAAGPEDGCRLNLWCFYQGPRDAVAADWEPYAENHRSEQCLSLLPVRIIQGLDTAVQAAASSLRNQVSAGRAGGSGGSPCAARFDPCGSSTACVRSIGVNWD